MQTRIVTQQVVLVQSSGVLYKIGDIVPMSGQYLCVPCGYVQEFMAGTEFTTCEACYAGTSIGPEGYEDPSAEFWQFVE